MVNPYLRGLRIWIWIDLLCLAAFVGVFSLGDPLGLSGVRHPALPLLFFLVCVTALGGALVSLLVVIYGVMASFWKAPNEPGTGLTP